MKLSKINKKKSSTLSNLSNLPNIPTVPTYNPQSSSKLVSCTNSQPNQQPNQQPKHKPNQKPDLLASNKLPTQALTPATQALALPTQALTPVTQAIALPTQAIALPTQALTPATQAIALPTQPTQVLTPATQARALPNQPTTSDSKQNNEKSSTDWDNLFKLINSNNDLDEVQTVHSIANLNAIDQVQSHNDNLEMMNLEASVQKISTKPMEGCYACGGKLLIHDNYMICQTCGQEFQGVIVSTAEDECTNTTSQDSNVNDKGFMSMRIIGKGSYGYNRNLLKSCADYSRYRKMTTLKEMHNWNSQSTDNQLPKNIINEANNMFALIKDHGYVFRKDIKKGVQGACLYYTCHINGLSKTPYEIAKIVGIAEKFLSSGDRILRDLNERGIIQIPIKIESIPSYIDRYFELLNIPNIYKEFVIDLIDQADTDKLHVLYDSKNNTKCIGAIYMLVERVQILRNLISKERIETDCGISKTTFIKYYSMLCKYYRKFVHIFAKHKIPLKSSWRETISDNPTSKPKHQIIYKKRTYKKEDSSDSESDTDSDSKSIASNLVLEQTRPKTTSQTTSQPTPKTTPKTTQQPTAQTKSEVETNKPNTIKKPVSNKKHVKLSKIIMKENTNVVSFNQSNTAVSFNHTTVKPNTVKSRNRTKKNIAVSSKTTSTTNSDNINHIISKELLTKV